jgi:predicted ATPase/class 3 adenylate cyclase
MTRVRSDERPAGVVTLLFTDIEGSTRLLQRLGSRYADLLASHHRLVRAAIEAHAGVEVRTDGDSFFAVFRTPAAAVSAAADVQRALAAHAWPDGVSVRVRIGVHTGSVDVRDGQYVGLDVHRAARIAAAAHGGQIVVSRATRDLVAADLPTGTGLRDLGAHRLKDIETTEYLHQLVLDGLAADFPPLRSQSARFRVLPTERSTFVGRALEIVQAGELLSASRHVTLTGPGGTGKTRLALAIAREMAERWRDGVAFVALASIADPRLVGPTIRQTLGFAEDPDRDAVRTLIDQLQDLELLLVLDNFEQVLAAATDVARLLDGTGRLRLLVTSRAALHLEGEQEFPVPPLGLPPVGPVVRRDEVARSEAVALFVERARLVQPGFELDERDTRAVALICARLDGLPLAIELAAARVKVLPPDALLARLGRRLELLATSGADRDARQRTLRATIDWSHDLLDTPRRALLRRLAVFAGSGSLEAIEAVLGSARLPHGLGDDDTRALDVLDGLAALVDHSLLRQEERDGEPRFLMLETVREYGHERLVEAGEEEAITEAHARWFVAWVETLAVHFEEGADALDRVARDHDNVRAAVRWALDRHEVGLALQAVGALFRFWQTRGHLAEALSICDEALALGVDGPHDDAAAQALLSRAGVRYWRGDMGGAREDYEQALALTRASGATGTEAYALFSLGYVYGAQREFDLARRALARSLALARELGDHKAALNAQVADANTLALEGDFTSAAAAYEAALPDLEATGDRFWILSHLVPFAWTMQRLGRLEQARDLHLRVLDIALEIGDGTGQHLAVHGLASIAAQHGDLSRALRMVGALDVLVEEMGGRAPAELVLALDPVSLAREQGAPEEEIQRLLDEGRRLDRRALFELSRLANRSARERRPDDPDPRRT